MWRSEQGNIVIQGVCRDLFTASLWSMAEDIASLDEPIEAGVKVFDRLSIGQQAAALHLVGPAALKPDIPLAELYAVTEGTLAAIFLNYSTWADSEIHAVEGHTDVRKLIIRAAKERNVWFDQTPNDDNYEKWRDLLDEISGSYLWDADYDMDGGLDLPQEASKTHNEVFGIVDDYYTWIPDDYTQTQIEAAMAELIELCRNPPTV